MHRRCLSPTTFGDALPTRFALDLLGVGDLLGRPADSALLVGLPSPS